MHVTPFRQDNGLAVFNKKVTDVAAALCGSDRPDNEWEAVVGDSRSGSAPSAHVGERPQHPLLLLPPPRLLLLPLHELPHLLILLSKHFRAPSGDGNFKGELRMKQKCSSL